MFQRFPLFERLITWTKLYAPVDQGSRFYEWYDWNSLVGDEPHHRALVRQGMDGASYFPSRAEMENGIAEFVERTGIQVRYECRWEATARVGDDFAITTTDGDYRCKVLVCAVGMTEPWKPEIPGIEEVPHYAEIGSAAEYAGKRVFIIGKRNSGFELADGLLPWARQIILGSPRPARISVLVHSTASARARYLQPYEDAILGGGNVVLDLAIERLERSLSGGWKVIGHGTTRPREWDIDVDAVIAATGFTTPLLDLPELGLATFYQGRLPAQTTYWESSTLPGVYFAGSITQGAIGMKKFGIPSNSAAVHGFRYNARVLADHIARTHFGVEPQRRPIPWAEVVPFLLGEASGGPELWNQQSYLARVVTVDLEHGAIDTGIQPLAHFVDSGGPNGVAITVETDGDGEIHPAVYLRIAGDVAETTLEPNAMQDFTTPEHHAALGGLLDSLPT